MSVLTALLFDVHVGNALLNPFLVKRHRAQVDVLAVAAQDIGQPNGHVQALHVDL